MFRTYTFEFNFESDTKIPSRYRPNSVSVNNFGRSNILKSRAQRTYEDLKDDCLKSGSLFEDLDFPAIDLSVYRKRPPKPFKWLRPTEIAGKYGLKPEFVVDGMSRFDVVQGDLGNCWMLAALSCLSLHPELMKRVIPPDQSFEREYAGIFRFRFWVFGKWVEVVVDDKLPTYNGTMVFLHSASKNEFWSCLLEKAYAKLNGTYEALIGGMVGEALADLTGGAIQMCGINQLDLEELLQIMTHAQSRKTLMACSIEAEGRFVGQELSNGLVLGHAYSITGAKEINVNNKKVALVRVRNPWGRIEWKGTFSDGSSTWNLASNEAKQELGLVFQSDGEFWMTYDDFIKNFRELEVCYFSDGNLKDSKTKWEMTSMEGSWKQNVTAGGCRNFLDTFSMNPQFRFEVTDRDETDREDIGTVIVSLMQKGTRKERQGKSLLSVGYAIYPLKNAKSAPLDRTFFMYNRSLVSSTFINLREVCQRHRLRVGHYVVIPSTMNPGEECDFLLRIYSENPLPSRELDDRTRFHSKLAKVTMAEPKYTEEDALENLTKEAFQKVSGADMEVDAFELQEILNGIFKKEFKFDGFSIETCKCLVATMDIDASGKLDYEEFQTLWKEMNKWKMVFKNKDADNSGKFDIFELRRALRDIGCTVSNNALKALVVRFGSKDGKMCLDGFIHLASRLSIMFDIYKEMSEDAKGSTAKFTPDSFIQMTMYA